VALLGWSWACCITCANGIRHLFWDAGKGFDIRTAYKSGYAVVLDVRWRLTRGQGLARRLRAFLLDRHEANPSKSAIPLCGARLAWVPPKQGVHHFWMQLRVGAGADPIVAVAGVLAAGLKVRAD